MKTNRCASARSASPMAAETARGTPRLLCPYCLRKVPAFRKVVEGKNQYRSCPECLKIVPILYAHKYDDYPPVVFSLVGRPRHGKTVYLASLLYALEQLRDKHRDFYFKPLDEAGVDTIRTLLDNLRAGRLPDSQPKMFPRPVILELGGVPRVGRCRLLLYDTGGEIFQDKPNFKEYGEYTIGSRSVVWLVSLRDLESPEDLDALLQVYTESLVEWGVEPKKQMLLVVLTKGDLLTDRPDLPAPLRTFLEGEEERDGFDPWQRLEDLSQTIEGWLNTRYNFPRAARETFATVKYCIVSALGHDPRGKMLSVTVEPRGVLLPLYWLWTFQGRPRVHVEENDLEGDLAATREMVHFSLEEAVARAGPGASLRLEAGIYRLDRPLLLEQPLELEGAGPEQTRVISSAAGYAVHYAGKGRLAVRGITFQYSGPAAAHVVVASQGEVHFEQCRFLGGRWEANRGGSGLKLQGEVRGTVRQCQSRNNACYGISVHGRARPVLENNTCAANEEGGIAYFGESGGTASGNTCSANRHGILVTAGGAPRLEVNCLQNNTGCGVMYFGHAAGTAVRNRCSANGEDGIYVGDEAAPLLEENACHENGEDGIYVGPEAGAALGENHCQDNRGKNVNDARGRR